MKASLVGGGGEAGGAALPLPFPLCDGIAVTGPVELDEGADGENCAPPCGLHINDSMQL